MQPPTQPPTQPPQSLEISRVPPALQRDHVILSGFCHLLQDRRSVLNATISLDEIVATIRGMLHLTLDQKDQKDASLRQSVRWVVCKIIDQSSKQAPMSQNSSTFSSVRDRSAGGTVGGVVCYGAGAKVLHEYTNWCIHEMQHNGEGFLKSWRPSRSSQSKAMRAVRTVRAPSVS